MCSILSPAVIQSHFAFHLMQVVLFFFLFTAATMLYYARIKTQKKERSISYRISISYPQHHVEHPVSSWPKRHPWHP